MVIKITETDYRGILCVYVKDKGWKIVLDEEEYFFKTFVDARFTIDRIHDDIVHKYGGKKMKKGKIV